MRLYPPAWILARQALREVELGGYRIPARAFVVMSPWVLHRDPRHFADPLRFSPERWLDGRNDRLPRGGYMPFGGGPRVCIGNAFAMMEARLILATVAQQYRLKLAPGHQVAPQRVFTLRPKYGMKMIAVRREPALELA